MYVVLHLAIKECNIVRVNLSESSKENSFINSIVGFPLAHNNDIFRMYIYFCVVLCLYETYLTSSLQQLFGLCTSIMVSYIIINLG